MAQYRIINILSLEPDRGFTALHVAVTLNIDNLVTLLLNRGSSTVVQDLQVIPVCISDQPHPFAYDWVWADQITRIYDIHVHV